MFNATEQYSIYIVMVIIRGGGGVSSIAHLVMCSNRTYNFSDSYWIKDNFHTITTSMLLIKEVVGLKML